MESRLEVEAATHKIVKDRLDKAEAEVRTCTYTPLQAILKAKVAPGDADIR